MSLFTPAVKHQLQLRLAIAGPSGSGKTYTALNVGSALGQRVAVIDSEKGSAKRYADLFQFDTCELSDYHPNKYIEAILEAGQYYDVLIVDSLTHAWFWELDQADSFFDWKKIRPLERKLVDAMLGVPCHLIATMRTKTEWLVEDGENKSGKRSKQPVKVGTSPIQASGLEYEFDIAGEIDLLHNYRISKTRCHLLDNQIIASPGKEFAETLLGWLGSGIEPPESSVSKCNRVKEAREVANISTEQVRSLIRQQFGVSDLQQQTPKFLTSEQCDQLVLLIRQQGSPVPQPVANPPSLDDALAQPLPQTA
ncbi:MAG: AAA family ATPase [Cyanothece sp. SIO2G6]|nr:AAA family ATPase [Cyanothece sp. SIO2G6]